MKKTLFLICMVLILTLLAYSSTFAIEGMITRIENDYVVINKGIDSRLQPGTILYVTRMNQPVGTIRVVQIDDYNSACQPVETIAGQQFQKGDLVSTKEFLKPDQPRQDIKKPTPMITSAPGQDNPAEKMKAQREYEKTIVDRYEKIAKSHTVVCNFKRGAGGYCKIDAMRIVHLALPLAFSPSSYSYWDAYQVYDMGIGAFRQYQATGNPERVRNVQMEITFWDTEYLDAFAAYYAFKESSADPRTINTIKENVYRQKGLDKFYVFQVKIMNPGPGSVQIAPFPLRFMLAGPGGKNIKADNYDEILDKALAPNQVVNGYVYFRRYDDGGQPTVQGNRVTIKLQDILGAGRTINFGKGAND